MNKTSFKRIRIGQEWYTLYIKDEFSRVRPRLSLTAAYANPSDAKRYIYRACSDRADSIAEFLGLHRDTSGICSYNCMMFTYGANFTKDTWCKAWYYETKTRRELHITEDFLDLLCDRIQTAKECGYSISIELE